MTTELQLTTLDLPITGMTCANCANTVSRALKKAPGVSEANVNYASERAQVQFDATQIKPAELIERVRKAGYDVTLAHAELPLLGMTCANCANTIERTLKKQLGVANVAVNYASERASIDFVPGAIRLNDMIGAVRKAGYDVAVASDDAATDNTDVEQAARDAEIADRKRRLIVGLIFALPAFVISMSRDFGILQALFGEAYAPMTAGMMGHEMPPEYYRINLLLLGYALPVMIYTAQPFFVHAWKAIKNRMATMDVLVALGSGVTFLYSLLVTANLFEGHVYFETAAMIVTLISVGKYLEARAKGRTGAAIKALMDLTPKMARVLKADSEVEVPVEQIKIGDVILVKPGERVATDGIVIEGRSAVDESMITGESLPVAKQPGANVIGGSVNKEGALKFEAAKVGKDTALAQIIKLVQQAQGSKAPIQALADRVSAVFVPVVLAIAALTFVGWLLIGQATFETALINAISVLVIACPCALGLATPTAIMVGMGKGAENGILFKNSAALEQAATISTVVLDKTGTITQGKPTVTDILDFGLPSVNWFALVATAEKSSEHPLAQAIVQAAESRGLRLPSAQKFLAIAGKGVTAYVEDQQVSVGNLALMQQQSVQIAPAVSERVEQLQSDGKTVMFAAINGALAGVIAISDAIKPTSTDAITQMKHEGARIIMLTGDNARAANAIAQQVQVDDVIADVLPADKANAVKALQSKIQNQKSQSVAMVGDGVNDAPALAQADIGIALGTGTDVAMEAADVTIMNGDLRNVPKMIGLSRLTVRGIRQNLFWAFFYNVILIPLAIAGVFQQYGPIMAAGAMAFSSLFVVGNALRLGRVANGFFARVT